MVKRTDMKPKQPAAKPPTRFLVHVQKQKRRRFFLVQTEAEAVDCARMYDREGFGVHIEQIDAWH